MKTSLERTLRDTTRVRDAFGRVSLPPWICRVRDAAFRGRLLDDRQSTHSGNVHSSTETRQRFASPSSFLGRYAERRLRCDSRKNRFSSIGQLDGSTVLRLAVPLATRTKTLACGFVESGSRTRARSRAPRLPRPDCRLSFSRMSSRVLSLHGCLEPATPSTNTSPDVRGCLKPAFFCR
ncbi:MAG: hypothetical protein JWO80_837 [Bryobacterales bacterium]|nr:hypothetical protein [Bryobacterales bacterium]